MEVPAATLAQISRSRDGKIVEIDEDVQGVANGLHEIDHRIRIRYSEAGEYFVVYWKPDDEPEGNGYVIFTATELDHRMVKRMQDIYWRCRQPGYSFADDLEAHDAAREEAIDYRFEQQIGEIAERLGHALRRDYGFWKDQARSKKAWGSG